jgi:hypothetical protein
MLDKTLLMSVQDRVFADPQYKPRDGKTFCNLATLAVCHGVGCHEFDQPDGQEPLLADEMYKLMRSSPNFIQKLMPDAIDLAGEGVFIIAALSGVILGQGEGHICTLTIGEPEFSGHWGKEAPACMNLGREGTCFRNKGANWAFKPIPDFFAWLPTL